MRFDKLLDKFNVEPEEYGTLPGKSTVCPPYNAVVRVHDVIARYK